MEQDKYLTLAAFLEKVAMVDGVTEQERKLLASFTQGFEAEFEHIKKSFQLQALQPFAHEAIRTAFVVAMSDNHLTQKELAFIYDSSTALGLTTKEVQELRELATEDILAQMLHLPAEEIASFRARFLSV